MNDFVVVESAVRQLHARYGDAVWRRDFEAFADCFTPDAEWRIAGMILRGRDEITEFMKKLMPRYQQILMTFRTPILEVVEGVANGKTYVSEQCALADGTSFNTIGIYYERFVDSGDRWRCTWRLFQLHYKGPADLSVPFFENPDFGTPPEGMPDLDASAFNHSAYGVDQKNI